jgi:hypothetical protein
MRINDAYLRRWVGNRGRSRLLRFWVKVPNTNSEIGTTCLSRARAWNG